MPPAGVHFLAVPARREPGSERQSIVELEVMMLKKASVAVLLLSGFLFVGKASFAQNCAQNGAFQTVQPLVSDVTPATLDEEIALMRSDLRANRKKVIAANMKFAPDEARWFWPTYEQYTNELVNINNAKYALIKEYLLNENMTDEQADSLAKRWIDVDASVVQLRLKYVPIFRKVLSAKTTAMFFQVDRRVQLMIDLQVASLIPLIQPSW
jgi:hypothetical protein